VRFAYAHKLSTYLMVFTSYFALATSGELSDLALLGAFVALIGSWFWEPPRIRFERFARAWSILTVLVFLLSVVAVLGGADFLLIGADFLLYLLVAKLFNRRACKDYQQVYILTFLMLVSGTVLNTEFTYGVFFLVYVVAATWALILFHLRREMEDNFLLKHSDHRASERVEVARILNSRRIVGGKFFVGTSMVSLTVFFLATVLFLMIPRIGFGLFFQKQRGGISMAGFSDGVMLGGHGTIKQDRTVVMRVKVDSAHQGRKAPYLHWRGVAFDTYSKREWRRTRNAPVTRVTLAMHSSKLQYHVLYDAPEPSPREMVARMKRGMRQEIYLEPLGYDVLFGASMPTVYEFDSHWDRRRRPHTSLNDEIRHPHTAGIKYVVYSDLDPPSPERLRTAPANFVPEGFDVYLQIPPEIPQRVRDLARQITRGATNQYDRAVAIETWLEQNLQYTLTMVDPGDMEPIDFFLFERKKGHCEYFASAMVILARAVGIPARNVNSFLGGEWNEYDDYIAVRAGDAHSWVEVYFPGSGWVTFDPTPPGNIDRLGRGGGGLRDRLRRFLDTLRFKWFKWVIEYDLYRQLSFFRSLGNLFRGGAGDMKKRLRVTGAWAKRNKATAGAVFGGILVLAVGFVLLRRRRAEDGAPTARARRARRTAIASLYNSLLTWLDKRGYKRAPSTTPREHAAALERSGVPGAAAFSELTEIYYAAEYGEDQGPARLERAVELRDSVGQAFRDARKGKLQKRDNAK